MLTVAQFAEQKKQLGHRIYEHAGWYWEETYPFYCKSAYVFKPIDRGAAQPPWLRSRLGYDHQVHRPEDGNQWRATMVMEREALDDYSLQELPSKKRNQVRRGLDHCAVRPIADINQSVERMREISVAQVRRQEQGAGAPYPAANLVRGAEEWRQRVRREFALPGRDWWGAFVGDELAAYARTYWVEGDLIFQQTKIDLAFSKSCPMDALYFTILTDASQTPECQRVINGRPMHESLNHFKSEYLFRAVHYPYYYSHARFTEAAKKIWLGFRQLGHAAKRRPKNSR
ncbi:MAG: hypothetical protein PHO14_00515 [Kiritimatiellae bacterium]|nr:hypothetical protein [Kiritimatiellia bacterium]